MREATHPTKEPPIRYLTLTALLACTIAPTARTGTSIQAQIRAAFPDDPAAAVCIARAESTLRPSALNGPHVGLFQISYRWHARRGETFTAYRARLSKPAENIALARRIYLDAKARFGRGWLPWSTRGGCGR